MTDFGREPRFGYFLLPNVADPLLETAAEAQRRGLDYVAVQDHPYQRRYVDTWSLMAMVLASTSRIGVFPDVANLPLRPPAVMAKAAATLDLLSGGRFDLGLGAGGFPEAVEAYGGPKRSPGEALAALDEAIDVIRAIWSGERNLRVDGTHYRLAGAHSGPVPSRPIGIWIGAYGPRALRLTARRADGWVPSYRGDMARLLEAVTRLDGEAQAAGRDPGEIRRILNVAGTVTTEATASAPFHGPPARWADELTDLAVAHGFDTFVLWAEGAGQLARFAEEIAPAVREQVAAERRP